MSILEAPAQLQAWIDELGDQIAVLSTRRYKLIDALNALDVPPATTAPVPQPDVVATLERGIAKAAAAPKAPPAKRARRRGLPPLEEVARVYNKARNTVDPEQSAAAVYDGRAVAERYLAAIRGNLRPIQSVADLFFIDKQLAAQWVRRARTDGELPPAAEPQLPEQERRAMLAATKPEVVV